MPNNAALHVSVGKLYDTVDVRWLLPELFVYHIQPSAQRVLNKDSSVSIETR